MNVWIPPFGFAPETPKTTLGTSFARDYSQDFAASGGRPSQDRLCKMKLEP